MGRNSYAIKIGSSPRMRGTHDNIVGWGEGLRFIPAHAGNADSFVNRTVPVSVHPRACGER